MGKARDGRFDTGTAALVLKTGDYPLHHGGLGIIRSLGRVGIRMFGVHEDQRTPAARSAYLAGGFVWRTGGQKDFHRQLLDGLGRAAERIGGPFVVIPTDDHGAVFLNAYAAELPESCLVPGCPDGLARDLVDKSRVRELAERHGWPIPATRVLDCPATEADLTGVDAPVVVKRAVRALMPDGSRTYSTVIARDRARLRELTGEAEGAYKVLLQEVVPGEPGDDWLFHAYCAADSRCLVSFTGRKIRSYPAYAGETAYAVAEDNPELREQVEHLLKLIGFVGIVSMDLRYDRRDRTYKVLDINPRTGAGFRLFENVHGVDVVRALHLDLSGRPVPQGPQRDNRAYVVENYDIKARRAYTLDRRAWLRQLLGAAERAWIVTDDLIPPAVLWLRSVRPGNTAHGLTGPRFFHGRRRARPSTDSQESHGRSPAR